jgi:S-adenosylmethionine:tRNA-ribosyltransferase-isomerase (queuine synthetase)
MMEDVEPIAVIKYRVSAHDAVLSDHNEQLKQIRKNGHEHTNALIKINEIVKRVNEANDVLNEAVEEGYKVICVTLERLKKLERSKQDQETEQKIKARYFRVIPFYALSIVGIFAAGHSLEMTRVLEIVSTFIKY